MVGRGLVEKFGWRLGDTIALTSPIFLERFEFVLRGIYSRADKGSSEAEFFFRWDYLNEILKRNSPTQADKVTHIIVRVVDPWSSKDIFRTIDDAFSNSPAATLTETEKVFWQNFASMADSLVAVIETASVAVLVIMFLVLLNSMVLSTRERTAEYAVLKVMGFSPRHIFGVICGESVAIAAAGWVLGAIMAFPAAHLCHIPLITTFPVFQVSSRTLILVLGISLALGVLAAIPPAFAVASHTVARSLQQPV